jgi:hypothetical protein
MPPELLRKIHAYRLDAFSVIDELKWYFYLINQGYTKKMAREHAMYYLLPNVIDELSFDLCDDIDLRETKSGAKTS